MIDNLKLIISLGAPMLGFLSTTIIVLKKYVKNNKLRKALEKSEEIINKIIPCVAEAENHLNYSGEEKKEYVMTKINQYAIENGITFDKEVISTKIEELIELSKKVNTGAPSENANELVCNNDSNKTKDIALAIQNIIDGLKS